MKVSCSYLDKDQFYEGMVLSVEKMEFNTDTQVMDILVKHCTSYDDL